MTNILRIPAKKPRFTCSSIISSRWFAATLGMLSFAISSTQVAANGAGGNGGSSFDAAGGAGGNPSNTGNGGNGGAGASGVGGLVGSGGGGGGGGEQGGSGGAAGNGGPAGGAGGSVAGAAGGAGAVGSGGQGGAGGGGGAHGFVGAALPGVMVTGGAGGAGGFAGAGANSGGGGGGGGFGAVVTGSGALGALGHHVSGGAGGAGGDGGRGGNGGNGGVGLVFDHGGATSFTIGSLITVAGGNGGIGGAGGTTGTGTRGRGGDGIVGSNLTLTNLGTIIGGTGLTNGNALTLTGGTNVVNFGGATSGMTGNISVIGSLQLNAAAGGTTVANAIAGTGSLIQNSANTLTLTGANTYSGGTNINDGTIVINNDSALGTGNISISNGGVLRAAADVTLTGSSIEVATGQTGTITADAGTTLTLNTGNFSRNIDSTIIFGTAGVAGTVVLDPASGASVGIDSTIRVAGGTLRIGSPTFSSFIFSSAPNDRLQNIVDAGATLDLNGNNISVVRLSGAGTLTNEGATAATLTLRNQNLATAFSGNIQDGLNPLALVKTGNDTLTLTGNNTYSGGTTVSAGTLSLGSNTAAGTGAITTTGSVIDYADGVTIANPIVINSAATRLQVLTGSATQSGVISSGNVITLEKIGAGALTLTGNNTYVGSTTVRNGTLAVADGGEINNPDSALFVGFDSGENATFTLSDGTVTSGGSGTNLGFATNSTGTLNITGGSLTSQTSLQIGREGTGTLYLSNNGTLSADSTRLAANSGSTGTANISGGSLTTSQFTIGSGGEGTLNFSNGSIVSGNTNLGLLSTGVGTVNMSGGTWTISDPLFIGAQGSGTLNLTNGTVSTLATTLGQSAGSSGIANLNGGVLATSQLREGNGNGTVTFNGGTLRLTADQADLFSGFETGDVQFVGPGGGTIDTQGFTVTTVLALTGTGILTKEGAGVLTLSGASTYSGGTLINDGTLSVSANNNLGNTSGGLSLDGGTLRNTASFTTARATTLGAGGGTFETAADLTHSGILSGSGILTKEGAGVLTLSGTNTYSGGTFLSAGTLLIGNNNALGTGSLTLADGTTLSSSAPRRITNNLVVNGDFNLFPGGTLTTFSAFELDGNMDLTGGNRTITNTMNFGVPDFQFGQVNLGGVISNGGLTFADRGITPGDNVVFFRMDGSAANTYTGDTVVGSNVSLTLAKDANVTAIAGDVIIQNEAALALVNAEQITDTSNLAFEGNGRVQVGLGSDTTETVGSLSDDGSGSAFISLEDTTTGSLLRVGSGSFSGTIEGGLAGGNSLEKYGTGMLTLTGANTYLGGTLVSAGTLLIHGSLGNSAVTVSNGATLGGTGSVGGLVTVNNGGFLAPGNSPGTFTVEALTLNSGSNTVFELGSPSGTPGVDSDLIDVNGLLTLAGGGIEIVNFGGMNTGTYTLFNYGSLSGSALPISSAPGGYNFDFLFDTPNQILLDVNYNGLQFWDGTNTSPPSTPGGQGGAGTWNLANTNWTNQPGNASSSWADLTAVFGGASGGIVTLGDDVAVAGLQFLTNGYQIAGAGHSITTSAPFNVLVDDGVTATIGAPITGTGALSKINSGTLVFTGNNTYSGGTTVSNGTLQLGNGGTTGMVAGNITNNANLIFDRTGDYFFNGVVSGNGDLIQNRSILRLSAAQTYTGSTTIRNNSILVLPFIDQSLSSATIVDIGAGSSLDISNTQLTISGLTGAGTVYSFLNSNPATGNLTLDIASGTSTIDGSFGGPFPNFSITKAGAGTQILTGNSSHTGTTTVSGGTLLVNGNLGNSAVTVQNNAMLGGSGILGGNLTIESGGILAPGNSTGILTIGGNLNLGGGSTTRMELNNTTPGTGHDQIVVGGTASLAGTLELFFGGGMTHGDTFTLIDTANPIFGNFDSVVNVLGNALTFSSTITDDYLLRITAVQTDYEPFAETPNQKAVATTIDDLALTGALNPLIDFLNTLPGTSLATAFDVIAPTQFAFLPDVAFAKTRFRQRGLAGQMRDRRGGVSGMSTSRLQVSSASGSMDWINSALMAPSHGRHYVSATGPSDAPNLPSADNRWGFFASGSIEHIDDDRNGIDNTSNGGGLTLGADYQLNESTIVGFFAGYEHSDLDFGNNGGSVRDHAATYGLYGTWYDSIGNWLEGSLGGGYHRYRSIRNVFGADATGKTHAHEFWSNVTYGHDFKLGSRSEWTLTPSAGLSYNALHTDGFTEGGSLAPLSLQSSTAESLRSEMSLRLDYRRDWSGVTWAPYVHCGWQHEFLDASQSASARFATGGGIFTVNGPNNSRNTAVFGTGLNALMSDTLSAGIGYNGEANNNFQLHQIFASLRIRF